MKKIPTKNYILVVFLLIVTVILSLYINNVIIEYRYFKSNTSPLQMQLSKINSNEVELAVSELNEAIIYVPGGYSKKNIKLERELLKKIESYNLVDYVYYSDADNINKYIKENNVDLKLNNAPALIYFKNGKINDIIDSSNKVISPDDFTNLIDKYKIGK